MSPAKLFRTPARTEPMTPEMMTPETMTTPRFLAQTAMLAETLKGFSADRLEELMEISPKVAKLNVDRWQVFQTSDTHALLPAALTFAGESYQELKAETFTQAQRDFAQQHIRILSGLYGLLRPWDGIMAHRLEMATRLETQHGKSLYDIWQTRLPSVINADLEQVAANADRYIISLASSAYEKAVDASALSAPLIRIRFVKRKEGKPASLGHAEKRARGAFTHYAVTEQVTRLAQLYQFSGNGFQYNADLSDDTTIYYVQETKTTTTE